VSMPPQVTYQVTQVAPDVQFGPGGNQIPGKQLTISTSTGYTGTVFIPSSMLGDLAAVQATIEAEVRAVAAVQAITGAIQGG
jgi:hypothetical protein